MTPLDAVCVCVRALIHGFQCFFSGLLIMLLISKWVMVINYVRCGVHT